MWKTWSRCVNWLEPVSTCIGNFRRLHISEQQNMGTLWGSFYFRMWLFWNNRSPISLYQRHREFEITYEKSCRKSAWKYGNLLPPKYRLIKPKNCFPKISDEELEQYKQIELELDKSGTAFTLGIIRQRFGSRQALIRQCNPYSCGADNASFIVSTPGLLSSTSLFVDDIAIWVHTLQMFMSSLLPIRSKSHVLRSVESAEGWVHI